MDLGMKAMEQVLAILRWNRPPSCLETKLEPKINRKSQKNQQVTRKKVMNQNKVICQPSQYLTTAMKNSTILLKRYGMWGRNWIRRPLKKIIRLMIRVQRVRGRRSRGSRKWVQVEKVLVTLLSTCLAAHLNSVPPVETKPWLTKVWPQLPPKRQLK